MFVSQIFDEAAEILGTTDTAKIFRKLTQALQTLMESGHWMHVTSEVDVCTGWDKCTVTLPREIEVPLAINVDGSPVYFRNRLFQYHVNKGGVYNTVDWAWDDRGFVATMMDIVQPSQLIAVAESDNDAGKHLRILGTDSNNRILRSQTTNGVGVDGLILPIHSQSDFQFGTITPDGSTIRTRDAAITPLGKFTTTTPHTLNSGEGGSITAITGTIPEPLQNGQRYYVGVVDSLTIQLYSDSLNAQAGDYHIQLQSVLDAGQIKFSDSRSSHVVTALKLSQTPLVAIDAANPVTFPAQLLPAPLISGATYFANLIDPLNLQIFASLSDAQNNRDPVYTSGSINSINVDIRKSVSPQTELEFNVDHFFATGDQVQAVTNGGVLPQPLIGGSNYYVRAINSKTVTLHPSASDAFTNTNAINMVSSGSGTNSLVKLLPASVSVGSQNNIIVDGFNLPAASGTGGAAKGYPSGIVTSFTAAFPIGSGYTSAPTVSFSDAGGDGYVSGQVTLEISGSNTTPGSFAITVTSGVITSVAVSSAGSGYQPDATVKVIDLSVAQNGRGAEVAITGLTPTGGIAGFQIREVGSGATATAQINATNNIAGIILNSPGSGYIIPPRMSFSGGGGTVPSGSIPVVSITTSFLEEIVVTSKGSGYQTAPAVVITGGGGSGAVATSVVQNGQIVEVNIITKGTGYTSPPTIAFRPSTGVFVSFSTTGTFPSPLTQGSSYRAEAPFSTSGFTAVNVDYSPVNITSTGTGQFYVLLSRPFSVGWTNRWSGDFSGLTTPAPVFFGTDFALPSTSPAIDNGVTQFWLNIDPTFETARAYNSQTNAQNGGTDGLVTILSFGTGQSYYAVRTSVIPQPYDNLIEPDTVEFLQDGEVVRASSSGTLPSPLVDGVDYTVKIFGNNVRLYDSLGNLVIITTPGIGHLSIDIERMLTAQPSTSIDAEASLYYTGQSITVRPRDGDTLPSPLVAGTSYYVRKLDANSFELYATKANATNEPSTTGRISFLTAGNSADSTFIIDAVEDPIFVKSVSNVEKPLTDGFVSLYAFDFGRTNDMTLIGQYHPSEVNPMYRRVRVGKPCAWVRIIYRVKTPNITSIYDYIPIEHERAILTALHAVDLEDKDFADQATRYWGIAFNYLRNQQDSLDGHAMATPQINNITYGDGTDPVMT
jgi:hypothetical protein